MVSACHLSARTYISTASKVCETAQLSPCLFWISLSMLLCSNDAWRQRYINYKPVAKISGRGVCGTQRGGGWVQEGKLRECTVFGKPKNGPGTLQIRPLTSTWYHSHNECSQTFPLFRFCASLYNSNWTTKFRLSWERGWLCYIP